MCVAHNLFPCRNRVFAVAFHALAPVWSNRGLDGFCDSGTPTVRLSFFGCVCAVTVRSPFPDDNAGLYVSFPAHAVFGR